jgi:hypothetical protein
VAGVEILAGHPSLPRHGAALTRGNSKIVTVWDRLSDHTDTVHYAPGYQTGDVTLIINQILLDQAVVAAMKADVSLVVSDLKLWNRKASTDHVFPCHPTQCPRGCGVCRQQKVVVILSNGGAIELPWVNRLSYLEGYLLGPSGGQAI